MSNLHYIFKLIIKSLDSGGNSCSSPLCLQKLFNICYYSCCKAEKYNYMKCIDGGTIKSLDMIITADHIIKPAARSLGNYDVNTLRELKKKLRDDSPELIQWSLQTYGTENPRETPLIDLQRAVNAGDYDDAALVFFTCFALNLPWQENQWNSDTMTFNGNANRDAIISIIDKGVKISSWGNDTFVINIPICKSYGGNIIYLTILTPKVHYSEILTGEFQPNAALKSMEKKIELGLSFPPLELLRKKFNRVASDRSGNSTLKEIINYLIHGRDKQVIENVMVVMPSVDAEDVKIKFARRDFEDVGDKDAAKMFDSNRMIAFSRSNPDVRLDRMILNTTTKITQEGIHVKAIGEAFMHDFRRNYNKDYTLKLDIKNPFMYMIGADAENMYSIGFVNN